MDVTAIGPDANFVLTVDTDPNATNAATIDDRFAVVSALRAVDHKFALVANVDRILLPVFERNA